MPAYLANLSLESKNLMEPISAKIPAAKTFPIPGIDLKEVYSVVLNPLMTLIMA